MNNWKAIRSHYKQSFEEMAAHQNEGALRQLDPYGVEFDFTPIERAAWSNIRVSFPMFPQYPVGKFFADFACPFKKVIIECDGKQWHDARLDRKRDAITARDGWTTYRVTGSECSRQVEIHPDYYETDQEQSVYEDYFLNTVAGVVRAIGVVHFDLEMPAEDYKQQLIYETLSNHRSEVRGN